MKMSKSVFETAMAKLLIAANGKPMRIVNYPGNSEFVMFNGDTNSDTIASLFCHSSRDDGHHWLVYRMPVQAGSSFVMPLPAGMSYFTSIVERIDQ